MTLVTSNGLFLNREGILEGERSCEKHGPHFVDISRGFIVLIPNYTAFYRNERG